MSNDFIPFAVGGSANVITQSAYAALTSVTQNGFSAGIAQSNQLNKVWRQSSIMSAVLAQFIVDQSGQNAVDDGTTATLETNLIAAIRNAAKQTVILTDTGAVNAYTATNTPALTVLPSTGYTQRLNIAHANTGASTYAPDGLTAKPIFGLGLQPLQGGELPVGIVILMYLVQAGVNSGNGAWIIIESLGGASQIAPATQSQHALQLGQATGRLLRTTVYRNNAGTLQSAINGAAFATASSTFTAQALTTLVDVEVLGAGGGGGGAPSCTGGQVSGGAGGGGGGYARGVYTSSFNGVTVSAGLAGAGGAGGANGTAGASSSFGALISATGGGGGSFSAAGTPTNIPGGVGVAGTGSNGQINSTGGAGKYFFAYSNPISGEGGASVFGGGATYANTGAGATSGTPGAGGAGAAASSNGPFTGGSGGTGLVIVREYA